jgi:colanic acid/amylovoran biosynthesis glycosyltransferase
LTGTLAIFTSQLGTASETFIRRHIEDVMPGRTVVIAQNSRSSFDGFWQASCPVLFLDRWALRLPVRIAGRLGKSKVRMREDAVERFLRQHGVSLVLGEYLDQFAEFVPLLDRMGLRYVVQGHGLDVSASLRKEGITERYQRYKSAAAILTRCEFHRQRLMKIGLPSEKIHVNPGGVDVPDEIPAHPAESYKRFLAIGRFVPKKGPIYLLEAFRLAAARDPAITLDYLGGGELLPAAQQFVIACRLEGRVRLHGAGGDDVKSLLTRECGVFLQHSLTDPQTGDEEGLPAAIQEAMAQDMAVISTRHAGIPEAIEDGVSGLLVEEKDVAAMAEAMLRVANDPALSARLGAAAHAKAMHLYSWPAEQARLLAFLDSAVSTAK